MLYKIYRSTNFRCGPGFWRAHEEHGATGCVFWFCWHFGEQKPPSTTSTLLSFTGIGLVAKIPMIMINVQLELARQGVSNKYATLCKIAAMELQWAAFLEQKGRAAGVPAFNITSEYHVSTIDQLEQRKAMLGAAMTAQVRGEALNARTGPATLIIKEIMAKHTFQGLFGA